MEVVAIAVAAGVVASVVAGWAVARRAGHADLSVARDPAPSPSRVRIDVLDRHPTGVVVCDADGVVEYRNRAAAGLVGTHIGVLVDRAIEQHARRALADERSSGELEFFGPPKRVLEVTSESLGGGRAVVFIDDISERRRIDQMRTDFVANVSHELRTPIGALMVLAETVADSEEPEVVERIVRRMQTEAERASRTIDDLLQLSELEAGRRRDDGPVRVFDVVTDAISRVAELAARREVHVTGPAMADPDGPGHAGLVVRGDRRQLASAVGNVVENGVRYGDEGGTVRIEVRAEDGWGEIVVADDGPGIPRADLDRIFERFYRVDRARSRMSGGTGLGLSIVRHVVQSHGGDVSVESAEGEGSTFVIRLPLVADEATAAEPTARREGVA